MHKKLIILASIVLFCCSARAQFNVRVVLDKVPAKHRADTLFITTDGNQWNPADTNLMFKKDLSGKYVMDARGVEGNTYHYKICRGTMNSVECAVGGKPIDPRIVTIQSDTTLHIVVAGWTDDFLKP
ncbi:MAG TPA: hypothetical protein VG101_16905 [Puia sp.]|jgi:hypothetical protein|nr:hypothetical protein [Puia sp.]